MSHRITDIKTLNDSFTLKAHFESGETKYYDMKPLIEFHPMFQTLSDIPELFPLAHLEANGYGVAWNNEIDIASEEIWINGEYRKY